MNTILFDGTWDEFCDNLIKCDIPSQKKAYNAGIAPNVYDLTFDHNEKTYTMTMDMIQGETLLNYINQRANTIGVEELDQILFKVADLYKKLFDCTKAHHPDFAARNIMIGTEEGVEKYFVIDFEAFYVDESNTNRELSDEDFKIAMRYFCCDLSCSFSGHMRQYLLNKKF